MFKVTKEWIHSHKTPRGGFTRNQLEAIGITWPPISGWVIAASCLTISDDQRRAFEQLSSVSKQSSSQRKSQKKSEKAARRMAKKRRKNIDNTHRLQRFTLPNDGVDRSNWKRDSDLFFSSDAWKKLRYRALQVCGGKCQCCGASRIDGAVLHVDHVKPRYIHPELQFDLSNLQVLCADCNIGKGSWDDTDWRTEDQRQQLQHMKDINGVFTD